MKNACLVLVALGALLVIDTRAQAQGLPPIATGQGYYSRSLQVMPEPSVGSVPYMYYGNNNGNSIRGYSYGTGNAYPLFLNGRGAYPYSNNGGYLYYGNGYRSYNNGYWR